MGVEEEIRALLSQGLSPTDVLSQHPFKKSTVYKVHRQLSSVMAPVSEPQWSVFVTCNVARNGFSYASRRSGHSGIAIEELRFLPGTTMSLSCELRNDADIDLYVEQSGLQPEWLTSQWAHGGDGQWIVSEDSFLLKPRASRTLRLNLEVPSDLPLGEYELRFGVQGAFVGRGLGYAPGAAGIQWAEPAVVQIKHQLMDVTVFLSHSVKNLFLVRHIEQYLDANGVQVIIGEDIRTPGAVLQEKFEGLIRGSTLLLALLTTEGLESDWVCAETNYAHEIHKPLILLKERDTYLDTPLEWIEFSLIDSLGVTLATVHEAIDAALRNGGRKTGVSPLVSGLIIGAVIGGLLARSGDSGR
jgi:hypothetical protein